jgi:hypothetical protein
MHISNANNQVHELDPPTCALLLSKNFDPLTFFNVAPSLSMSMSMSNLYFLSLYNLFPFVINFHKRCASYWYKRISSGQMVDTWILHFWWTPPHMLEWHHLYSSWDASCRIFDLDTNQWDTSPYVIAWVIHLINLSSCRWGMHSSFDDHLKLRITCGTIVLHDWYHV